MSSVLAASLPGTASPSASLAASVAYRAEVDGLRALAVLSVIFFHAGLTPFTGGFVGVDVFFVISGFLITGIILKEQERGTFSLAVFYARRARRILPALVLVLLACVPPALAVMNLAQLGEFFRMVGAVGVVASNLLLARTTGYFDAPAEDRPLLHTWSLAVEEQFYLLFPLFLLITANLSRRAVVVMLGLMLLASLGYSEWGWRHDFNSNFFLAPGRAWELLAGCVGAFVVSRRGAGARLQLRWRQWLAAAGLLAICGSVFLMNRYTPSPSVWIAVPVFGTVLVLVCGLPDTWAGRLLAAKPCVAVGLVSYSAYLWHQPLLAFARIQRGDALPLSWRLTIVIATLVLAALSWKFVEQPFRKARPGGQVRTLKAALACTLGLLLVGALGSVAADNAKPAVPARVLAGFQPPPRSAECFDIPYGHQRRDGWLCGVNPGAQARPTFMLFGDSHALQLLEVFEQAARATGRSGVFTGFSGCAPFLGVYPLNRPDQATRDCRTLNDRVLAHVRQSGIKDVYLVGKWSYYTDSSNSLIGLNALGLEPSDPVSLENSRRAFALAFAGTVRAYAALGVRVHVVEQAPLQRFQPRAIYERGVRERQGLRKALGEMSPTRIRHRQLQAFPASVFRQPGLDGSVDVLNFDDVFCDDQRCLVGTPELSYYMDISHLSTDGARRMGPRLTTHLAGGARAVAAERGR